MALLLLDRTNDAVISVGLALINSVISSVQEIRAKRKLDQLKLLHRASCLVVRGGVERTVPPEQIVRGDLIHVRRGDQIVVDGPLVAGSRIECDESLLTGESEPVVKLEGGVLLSGSSCLSGDGLQRADAVGAAMQSGSAVTRDVADLVLLDDSFAALTAAQDQGRRIISGISTSLNLFLARVATSTLIIIVVAVIGLGFPYEPAQVALTLFTVGLPTFFLTRWAPARRFDARMIGSLARFVGPASLTTAAFAAAIYVVVHQLVEVGIGRGEVPSEVLERFSAHRADLVLPAARHVAAPTAGTDSRPPSSSVGGYP